MAATKFSFYVISTSDRGDFPRIIVIALFVYSFVCLFDCLYPRLTGHVTVDLESVWHVICTWTR